MTTNHTHAGAAALFCQAVGWIVGFVMGDFTYTLMGWAAGMVLSIIVSCALYSFSYHASPKPSCRKGIDRVESSVGPQQNIPMRLFGLFRSFDGKSVVAVNYPQNKSARLMSQIALEPDLSVDFLLKFVFSFSSHPLPSFSCGLFFLRTMAARVNSKAVVFGSTASMFCLACLAHR